MARSCWKGYNLARISVGGSQMVWQRSRRILMKDVGQLFKVHNGKRFGEVLVNEWMVGRFFGEFVMSRRMDVGIHGKKSKKRGK